MKLLLVQGYNSILVVYKNGTLYTDYRKNKYRRTGMIRNNIWKLHGLPDSIISDKGPQFTAGIMRELNCILGIETKLSTAFHLQTDGQTERMNQELEQYLWMFIDH